VLIRGLLPGHAARTFARRPGGAAGWRSGLFMDSGELAMPLSRWSPAAKSCLRLLIALVLFGVAGQPAGGQLPPLPGSANDRNAFGYEAAGYGQPGGMRAAPGQMLGPQAPLLPSVTPAKPPESPAAVPEAPLPGTPAGASANMPRQLVVDVIIT